MSKTSTSALTRRRVFAGAGVAGAAAVAAALLPRAATPTPGAGTKAAKTPDANAGYQVSEHVLHYYRTARV